MDDFIKANGLIKRNGFDEWYAPHGCTRLVKVGNRWRMDVQTQNWSAFKSQYIVGLTERDFHVRPRKPAPARWPKKRGA